MKNKKYSKQKTLPTKVRILNNVYDIKYLKNPIKEKHGTEVYGQFFYSGYIYVVSHNHGNKLANSRIFESLIHECLHAIFFHFCHILHHNTLLDDEENIVRIISTSIISLFKDNPQLQEFL